MAENVNEALIANAIGGGGADEIRRALVKAMIQRGTSGEPVQHFTQGLHRVAEAMLGGLELRDLDRSDRAHMAALTSMLTGGGGGPGVTPGGGRPMDSGPRSASLPPMAVEPEPQRPPPGTVPVRQATEDLQPVLTDPELVARPQVMGGVSGPQVTPDMMAAARAQMARPLAGGQQGAFGQNALPNSMQDPGFAVPDRSPPPPDPALALQSSPQGLAGAIPPPLAPPGPPAGGQRPLTPPAPTAPPAGAVPGTMPEQRRAMVQMMLHPRTPPAAKAMIAQQLNPKWETKTLPNGDIAAINERTNEVRIIHKGEPKPTDDSLNLKEFNDSLPPGQKRLTLPEFKALQEATKTTAELRAKSDFAKGEQRPRQEMIGGIVSQDVGRIIERVNKSNWPTTGAVGSALSTIGGTPPGDVADLLKGLEGHVATDTLQKMREASPTGASGFGALTHPELELIKSTFGSLKQRQSKEQFLFNLRRFEKVYSATIHGGLQAGVSAANEGGDQQGGGGGALQPGVYDWSPSGMKRR